MPSLDTISKAAQLHRQGLGPTEIAAKLDPPRSRSTVQRWASDPRYAHLFERHEPGSLEHRRAILLQALETGSLSEQLRAVELLDRIGEKAKPSGSARLRMFVASPGEHWAMDTCPGCGAMLLDGAKTRPA